MATRTTLLQKEKPSAVDSDDSDASGTSEKSRDAAFFSLPARSSRARARLAAAAVVAEVGSGARARHILRRVLHLSRPSLRAMLQVVQRRASLARAAMTQCEASGKHEAEMEQFLGGGRLAAVFASKALPEEKLRSWQHGLPDVRSDIPSHPQGLSTASWGDPTKAASMAGSDTAAAGLSTRECAWVSQKAARVARERTPTLAFNRDVATVRNMLAEARLPDGDPRAAALLVLGTALSFNAVRAALPTVFSQGNHHLIVPLAMDISVFARVEAAPQAPAGKSELSRTALIIPRVVMRSSACLAVPLSCIAVCV